LNDDLDVQCLPYMPLQIERLRKSKAWLRCKRRPEMAFYLMNLWMRAWHELPAGSIEDDDDILADAAMCSPDVWTSIKDEVLVGWERRNGRLFHSTVTEIATEAASKLRKNRSRTAAAREALQQRRDSTVTEIATEAATSDFSVTENVTDIVTSPEGKGREEKKERIPSGSAGAPLEGDSANKTMTLEAEVYAFGKRLLGKSSGGVITKLRRYCRGDLYEVMAVLRQAEPKAVPMEWISAVLKGEAEDERREAEIYSVLQ